MEHVFPADVAAADRWPTCDALMPHSLSAARYAGEQQISLQKVTVLFVRIGEYLRIQGMYEDILRRPHDFTSPGLPEVLVRVGMVLRAGGNLPQSLTVLEEVGGWGVGARSVPG